MEVLPRKNSRQEMGRECGPDSGNKWQQVARAPHVQGGLSGPRRGSGNGGGSDELGATVVRWLGNAPFAVMRGLRLVPDARQLEVRVVCPKADDKFLYSSNSQISRDVHQAVERRGWRWSPRALSGWHAERRR